MKKTLAVLLAALMMLALTVGCTVDTGTDEQVESDAEEEVAETFSEIEHVYITDNATKVYRDAAIEKNGVGVMTASLARNEDEGMQFVLYFDESVENVKVTVSDLVNKAGEKIDYTLYRQYYYEVTGTKVKNQGWVPDGLIPMFDGSDGYAANDTCTIEAGQNQGYWITLSASDKQAAGKYSGTVTVTYGTDGKIEIPVRVTVWDFEIPVTPTMETMFSAGWTNEYYEDYGLTSEEANLMAWKTLLQYRISGGRMSFIPYATYGSQQADYVKAMAEFIEENPAVTVFQIPLYGYSWDAYQTLDDLPDGIVNNGTNISMYNLLVENGLVSRACYYFIDEPSYGKKNVCLVQGTSLQIKQFAPGVRNIVPLGYDMYGRHESEIDALNGWCPIITDVSEDWVRSRTEKGDSVWWYCCVAPDMPYPTYRQNDNGVAPRVLHWMQRDYGIQGELYWATTLTKALKGNSYSADMDLWTTLETQPGVYGDGILLIPGTVGDGVVNRNMYVPTLRLEMIRDGMEDYEYLTILENKVAEIIKNKGYDITADAYMDTFYDALYAETYDYNKDTTTILTMRKLVAKAILSDSDTLVGVKESETSNFRTVYVYAPSGTEVSAEGLTFTETAQNGYSLYTAEVDMADGMKTVEIKVGTESYTRILGLFEYVTEDDE